MKKTIPTFQSDEEAEKFVDAADLSEYNLSGGTVVHFWEEIRIAGFNNVAYTFGEDNTPKTTAQL